MDNKNKNVYENETIADITAYLRKVADSQTALYVEFSTDELRSLAKRMAAAYVRDMTRIADRGAEVAQMACEMCKPFAKHVGERKCEFCKYANTCIYQRGDGRELANDCEVFELDDFYAD